MKKILSRDVPEGEGLVNAGLHPVLQRILRARGVTAVSELDLGLGGLLPYTELMGITEAVAVLCEALVQQKKVLVVGDFDADGATSTALAVRALRAFGLQNVNYLVPSRFEFGYGLTPGLVEVAAKQQPQLIITVDNGISSLEGVATAQKYGIEVLVTDHHLPGVELPQACAIVNPSQRGDKFASKNLAGVGVIFYVMVALRAALREQNWFSKQQIPEPNMGDFLDLVALGTVADVVPLDRNNRILVQQGLQKIRAGRCCYGMTALLQVANCKQQAITAVDLGYRVAPRLNAAGRLVDMKLGIAGLLTDDSAVAADIAEQLHELNQERRAIEGSMQQQIAQELLALEQCKRLPRGICLFNEEWHQGVVGLLASRVKERLHRPVIAFAKASESEIKGSARSISGVHIRDALEEIATQHPELIVKFGGHAMAAGLTLQREKYPDFCRVFVAKLDDMVADSDLEEKIYTDGELQGGELSLEMAELVRKFGPWGQSFPMPSFHGVFSIEQQQLVANKHLKLVLTASGCKYGVEAIAFNVDLARWPDYTRDLVDIVYRLDVNEYKSRKRLQLIIENLL